MSKHQENMDFAKFIATKSKDPSTKVGCAISLKGNIVSFGWNRIPERILSPKYSIEDREWKYPRIIHAEQDAIMKLPRTEFISGGVHLYCTHYPCDRCAAMIAHAGIDEVFTQRASVDMIQRWGKSMETAASIFKEAGIPVNFLDG